MSVDREEVVSEVSSLLYTLTIIIAIVIFCSAGGNLYPAVQFQTFSIKSPYSDVILSNCDLK